MKEKQAIAIASETEHQETKGRSLACFANAYFHQEQYFQALWLIIQSLLILPPWASANGRFILKKTFEEIIQLVRRLIGGLVKTCTALTAIASVHLVAQIIVSTDATHFLIWRAIAHETNG